MSTSLSSASASGPSGKAARAVSRLLRRNLSVLQLAGFVVSNFIGLAIVIAAIQFYADIRPIWENDDSFINRDFVIVNKRVSASHMMGSASTGFSRTEIDDMESQPWLRRLGEFTSADYEVRAYMTQGDRGMSTSMFLEAIPDEFIDVDSRDWSFAEGDEEVPVIISKDYLTLYNFGFASSAGLPQLTEGMLSSIPLSLRLSSRDGSREVRINARIAGFSSRLNTILVPEAFMEWSNAELGDGSPSEPRRLILDVSSPGDVAISDYLSDHALERAGGDEGSQASYFLRLVAGLVIAVGALITLLSFFILLLSVALLMQKNRPKLHALIMLGYDLKAVGAPYRRIILFASLASYALATAAMLIFRNLYIGGIETMAGSKVGVAVSLLCGAALVVITLIINFISVNRRVRRAFYI